MNGLTILGGVICLSLSGAIAAELLTDIRPAKALAASTPAATAESPASEPSAALSDHAALGNHAASAQAIDERPLFSPSRRPVAVALNVPAPQVEMTVKPFGRRLTGIVVEAQMRAAVFAGEGSRSVVVKEGEPIDGWFLEAVTSVNVTMRAAGASQVIELIKSKITSSQSETRPATPSLLSPVSQVPPPLLVVRNPASPLLPPYLDPVR